ncbi:hypothetical protein CY34DRAFT_12441 [Suillus luteus UH-Slu-Lm8-n1]|uniref:Uncharacterized protein n=1 Tax=Suillus luteus UH-Slu-Lm8-n1 TaxID=930992 RepID=A0A0C9ZWX4_9AGAM|nr:hypothetical protein CY34DRAFT_12441 [Suillus luteus UH-Slu-Lm8-n1]
MQPIRTIIIITQIRCHQPTLTLTTHSHTHYPHPPAHLTHPSNPPPQSQSGRADGRQFEMSCSGRVEVPAYMLLKRINLFLADGYCGLNIDISAAYWDASSYERVFKCVTDIK